MSLEELLLEAESSFDGGDNKEETKRLIRLAFHELEAQNTQLEHERNKARGQLLHLATALRNTFSCTEEGGEEGHDDYEDCWRCWADRIVDGEGVDR